MKEDKIGPLIKYFPQKDYKALAKTLSLLDRWDFEFEHLKPLIQNQKHSLRLGITGPPGAGKSTLINEMIRFFRSKDFSVGVLAVDPSSPFSMGAVLGDRIRYNEFFNDPKVYIRSLGSRGSLGGLSASAYLMLRAYDLFEFDVVLIETVGVGQTELDIMNVADILSVVLVPESGDSIQAMKAGLLEITQLFVVNKADRPGSEVFSKELQATLEIAAQEHEKTKIFLTQAKSNIGVQDFCEYLMNQKKSLNLQKLRNEPKKLQYEALSLIKHFHETQLKKQVSPIQKPEDMISILMNFEK